MISHYESLDKTLKAVESKRDILRWKEDSPELALYYQAAKAKNESELRVKMQQTAYIIQCLQEAQKKAGTGNSNCDNVMITCITLCA